MENYVKIKFIYYDDIDHVEKIESMWASKLMEGYKIENSPFYTLNYSLGDIISVKIINGELYVKDLIKSSGNSTVQIIFYNKEIVQETRDELRKMGCSSELSNLPSLISVNIPSLVDYYKIRLYLEKGAQRQLWDYQEACIAH